MTLGLGAGSVLVNFYRSWSSPTDGQYLIAGDCFPALRYSAELTIPVVGFGNLWAGLAYTFVPVGSLMFEHDGGDDYYVEYREPNLGGLSLQLGLAAEL